MTHPNFHTNGASLEDCHTNFFALMDLCGIKWRRLSAENLLCVDPLDDPVLLSFTRCLAADILCVWRRVPPSQHGGKSASIGGGSGGGYLLDPHGGGGGGGHHHQQHPHRAYLDLHSQTTASPLLHKKELWIFWYGNEPDLSNILCTELLAEVEQGSWENGLSYECRTLLFKAIHNRIERSLLSRDYVRLGKWFVQPCDVLEKSIKSRHSLSFSFFIHGESTVCASVDVREHPLVRRLTQEHLMQESHGSQVGIQVILGPYGQSGILTGQVYKDNDVSAQKLLDEWRQFFPVDAAGGRGSLAGGGSVSGDCSETCGTSVPAVVEVIVGGVKLRYPSCYVLVVDMDETNADGVSGAAIPGAGMASVSAASVPLTPPTSPCDPATLGSNVAAGASSNSASRTVSDPVRCDDLAASKDGHSNWESSGRRIMSHVCQDGAVMSCSGKQAASCDDPSASSWDFSDPTQKASCSCSKCKKIRQGSGGGKSIAGASGSSSGPTGNKKGDRSEKSEKQPVRHIRSTTPFHRRSTVSEGVAVFDGDPNVKKQPVTTSAAASFQFKAAGAGPRPPTPSSVQAVGARTGALDAPLSLDSPASVAPSPSLGTSHSQPTSIQQPDSVLVASSPNPAGKEPDTGVVSIDEAALGNAAVSRQDTDKTEQVILSPLPIGSLEPPKSVESGVLAASQNITTSCGGGGTSGGSGSGGGVVSSCSGVVSGASQTNSSSSINPMATLACQVAVHRSRAFPVSQLKRPVLPRNNYDELDNDEPTTESLYDYSSLHAWLQHPVKRLKLHQSPPPPSNSSDHLPNGSGHTSVGDSLLSPDQIKMELQGAPLTPQGSQTGDTTNQLYPVELGSTGEISRPHGGSPGKPADPYEFVDDFPTTVSMAGFKSKNEPGGKEDEKGRDCCGGNGCPPGTGTDPSTPFSITNPPTPSSVGPQKETCQQAKTGASAADGSPPTPQSQNGGGGVDAAGNAPPTTTTASLLREMDLVAKYEDLNQLFDTSDDDTNNDTFQPPNSPPGSLKPSMGGGGMLLEDGITPVKGGCKTATGGGGIGILGPTELSRMFPTPPSLEQASPCGPIGGLDSAAMEIGGCGVDASGSHAASAHSASHRRRRSSTSYDAYSGCDSPSDDMDWSYVFRPMAISTFVGSSKYAPMASLPSHLLQAISLPSHCIYKPSWQHPPVLHQHSGMLSSWDKLAPASHLTALSSVDSMDRLQPGSVGGGGCRSAEPSPATYANSVEPRLSQSFELQSPASNASYLNKNLNSMDDSTTMGCGHMALSVGVSGSSQHQLQQLHVFEAHSLLLNLALSDSLLNVFKDHNFDSSTMCVCHMDIRGSDTGTYLPEAVVGFGGFGQGGGGSSLAEEQSSYYKCTCGFSAVVNRRLARCSGLFYEDELEITGLRNESVDRRKNSLLAATLKYGTRESMESSLMSNNLGLRSSLDNIPPRVLDLLRTQCTTLAMSTCDMTYKTRLAHAQLTRDATSKAVFTFPPRSAAQSAITNNRPSSAASIAATISAVAAGYSHVSPPPTVPVHWQTPPSLDTATSPRLVEIMDGCEATVAALDQARHALLDHGLSCSPIGGRVDDQLKVSVLHRWPFVRAKLPSNNQDLVRLLRMLQPLLQDAVHKKPSTQFWEATTTTTYTVSGPLTWRQFLKLAGRSTEDQCEPQPIPSLLVGYDKDWLALSPFAIKYWEKLLLEPYSLSRDVAYIVVAPDNSYILSNVKTYFRELSGTYEVCRLGRHSPITKVLIDGVMRVGKAAARNLADEKVDEWFNLIGDTAIASKLKLYAQVCRHHLAPHLTTLTMDGTLLEPGCHGASSVTTATSATDRGAASPQSMPPPPPSSPEGATSEKDSGRMTPTPKPVLESNAEVSDGSVPQKDTSGGASASASGIPMSASSSASSCETHEAEEETQPPAVVIYVVDPFTYCGDSADALRLASLGLLRCHLETIDALPEHMRSNVHLQIVPLEAILEHTSNEDRCKHSDQLKSLAFGVFSQCRRTLAHQSTVKSLTGFGPAAAVEAFLKAKDERNSSPYRMYSPPFILAPMKDKQTQLTESFGDHRERATVLYCTYCLSEDQRWLLATCTDDRGEILETCVINIDIPNRHRRKKASARKVGLQKLMDWILGVMSTAAAVMPWRLVVGRMGRLGHGELKGWSNLLSKKTLLRASKHLRDSCRQCLSLNAVQDTPCILSACLVSLEADSALRVLHDQFTPDESFGGSSCQSCDLSTPQDASCTHILVFPTSATTQSTQATYQEDPINALGPNFQEEDILSVLQDEEGQTMSDIHAIFNWTTDTSPGQSPVDSDRRESNSRSGSPSGHNGRQSPFQNGAFSRGVDDLAGDPQEETPQLQQQPLALGYYVSTAQTGPLPDWFWVSCAHVENVCPAFLKSALHIHCPTVQQSSDDLFQQSHLHSYHPLDSNFTTDVLRYVLEGYNALSWLAVDPLTHDRRSCLPVHVQVLMQMYYAMAALV